MSRRVLHIGEGDDALAGWVEGAGAPLLLLHGGPGLNAEYLEPLVDELLPGHQVAWFQQRGLAPSSTTGPFTVADHVADAARALDALGWEAAVVVGHSWGGHLGLHVAAALPGRVGALLAVDPLGGVGDGGRAQFEATLLGRVPPEIARRAEELDAAGSSQGWTAEAASESVRLVWPAYFPSWDAAPAAPELRMSIDCYEDTMASVAEQLPALESALVSLAMPVAFVTGQDSPMPQSAATETAARIPTSWVRSVRGAGHFIWLDVPGAVRAALDELESGIRTV
ncbi:alpha/beta fold hydrolase [Pedococcus sp. 5OH_020]|uniref:alpha/beta fold hydrolase n=1 Tax=Pedococcus sp. 5OH_020 TaxID=2989814 RepID=UPI0022E9EB2B|nr:alpha/beta hydrolase [Pedococcus sp. 5OH_020]